MLLLKFFKFYSCHNFKGCSLCNFARCKITKQLFKQFAFVISALQNAHLVNGNLVQFHYTVMSLWAYVPPYRPAFACKLMALVRATNSFTLILKLFRPA